MTFACQLPFRSSRARRRAAIISLVAGFLPVIVLAQAPAASSAPAPDGTRLRLHSDSLAVYYVDGPDTTHTGVLHDQLDTVRVRGRLLLQRVYESRDRVLGSRVDTIVSDFRTLAPVRTRSRASHGFEFLDYGPGRVTGWLWLVNGNSIPVDVPLAQGTFDAATFDLVLRASSIGEGFAIAVPSFLASTRTVTTLTARLAGTETIGGEPCWRLDAVFGQLPVSFWIGQETRTLRRQVMHLRPGKQVFFAPFPAPAPRGSAT